MGDRNTADTQPLEGFEDHWSHSSAAPFLGELNNRFRVRRLLGSGGMSIVLEAHDEKLDRDVAIKLVRCGPGAEARARRLLREARTVARLRSPYVVSVLDWGWLDAHSPFIVMELLSGRDLGSVLRADGPLPLGRALRCMVSACDALVEAHAAGIIHRDLKPSNLFLLTDADGRDLLKVLDFGLVKELHTGAASTNLTRGANLLGTPRYMAPEQLTRSAKLDERVDVWAAAVTLYELVTGRTPFDESSRADLLHAILSEPARRLRQDLAHAPPELEALLLKCLEKAPDQRLPSLRALAAELGNLLASVPAAVLDREPSKETVSRVAREASVTYAATSGVRRSRDKVTLAIQPRAMSSHGSAGRQLLACIAFGIFPASARLVAEPVSAEPLVAQPSPAPLDTEASPARIELTSLAPASAGTVLPSPIVATSSVPRPRFKASHVRPQPSAQSPAPPPAAKAEPAVVDLNRAISTRK